MEDTFIARKLEFDSLIVDFLNFIEMEGDF